MTALRWPTFARFSPAGLTRESRDTLLILAVLGWTLLPQLGAVPAWCGALAYGALGWRGWLAWRSRPLPPRWLLAGLLVVACVLTWREHRSLIGRDAGLSLLVLLAALKTLELRARRDALVVFFLGFFLVLGSFLRSQSLWTALAMAVSVWGLLAALLLAHMPVGRPPLQRIAALSARLMLVGLPLVVALFLFFPRLAPLWGVPGDVGGRTGLSDQMQLGDVAELAQDDSVALRVRFSGPVPPPQALYFRGPVLSVADGMRWRAWPRLGSALPAHIKPLGMPIDYEMTVEPLRVATLPLLELTPAAPTVSNPAVTLRRQPDLQWTSDTGLTERLRVRAQAWPQYRAGVGDVAATVLYLDLPAGAHPRTRAWAQAWRRDLKLAPTDTEGVVAALLAHIAHSHYIYTLAPGGYGAQAVDEFWLDRREGFCEHYASAFVVVLRALGVPARIVTGYQGGQVNPVDGVLEVRQSDAHAWTEYWTPQRGWVRADPTAAVAPERIQRGQRLTLPPGLMAGTLGQMSPALLQQAQALLAQTRALWGALDHQWNEWVLGHNRQRQLDWLRQLGWPDADLADLTRGLALVLAALALLGAAAATWQSRRTGTRDPWLRGYRQLQAQLVRRGLPCPAHQPPRSLVADLRARYGERAEAVAQALLALEAWRYQSGEASRAELRVLIQSALRAVRSLPRMAEGTEATTIPRHVPSHSAPAPRPEP